MPATRTTLDLDWQGTPVRLVRSTARTRTVSAQWRDGRLQVSVPARLSRAEERAWIGRMVERAGPRPADPAADAASDGQAGADAHRPGQGRPGRAQEDAALAARARRLVQEHLAGAGLPEPASVSWSARQRRRWGSCTPARRTIRLSTQLHGMPDWVVDAVLVHELAHLREPGHGPRFQALTARFPRYAEAMAFLAGVSWAQGRGVDGQDPGDDDVAAPGRTGGDGAGAGWDDDVEPA